MTQRPCDDVKLRVHEIKPGDIGWFQVKIPLSYGITRKNGNFLNFLFRDKLWLTLFILHFNFFSCHRTMLKHCHWAICSHMSSKNIKVFFFSCQARSLKTDQRRMLSVAGINWRRPRVAVVTFGSYIPSPLSYHSSFLTFLLVFYSSYSLPMQYASTHEWGRGGAK